MKNKMIKMIIISIMMAVFITGCGTTGSVAESDVTESNMTQSTINDNASSAGS